MDIIDCTLSEFLLYFVEGKTFNTPHGVFKVHMMQRINAERYFVEVEWTDGRIQKAKIIFGDGVNTMKLLGNIPS